MGLKRQQGMALVIVLMLFAIISALTVEVLVRQDRFLTRADNLLQWDQRYQYAIAAEVVAVQALTMDLRNDMENDRLVDDCEEQWAIRLPPTPYDDALLSASVQDLQGRFNLNWLVTFSNGEFVRDDSRVEQLTRLLQQVLPEPNKASLLANEMADWIDSNTIVDGLEGAEDADYRHRRTPNMPVAHESELRALRSFTLEDNFPDSDTWGVFSALPLGTTLNINTAPEPVLDAVVSPLAGAAAAQRLIDLRNEAPITDLAELNEKGVFEGLETEPRNQLLSLLGVSSDYFQVMVDVAVNNQYSRLITRLRRSSGVQEGDDGTVVFSRQISPLLAPLEPACNPFYNAQAN